MVVRQFRWYVWMGWCCGGKRCGAVQTVVMSRWCGEEVEVEKSRCWWCMEWWGRSVWGQTGGRCEAV